VVDFFGDIDLFPHVKDASIIIKRLGTQYTMIKDDYGRYLVDFSMEMLKKHPEIDYLLIGSGLDDDIEGRNKILDAMDTYCHDCLSLNNNSETIVKSRDILYLYSCLTKLGIEVPKTNSCSDLDTKKDHLLFPLILKRIGGSGGLSVFKIDNQSQLDFKLNSLRSTESNLNDWVLQEFIEGIPVSCTIISDGREPEVISVNRQIIGLKFLNPPKDFMYCGNIVPANLLKSDTNLISELSLNLARHLKLKGINGLDYVLKNNQPYLMEINPRIPGSIEASELALNLNLLDLNTRCFEPEGWSLVRQQIQEKNFENFATKLIVFAPTNLDETTIKKINALEQVHDKNDPTHPIFKGEPICTILYQANSFSDSYFGALKLANKIKDIIEKKE